MCAFARPTAVYCNNKSKKDTEKYVADNEAIQSNIKLLTNIPIEDKQPRLQEADGLLLVSLQKI